MRITAPWGRMPSVRDLTEKVIVANLVAIGGDLPLVLCGEVLLDRLFRACGVADEDLERGELVVVERAVVAARAA